MTRPNAHFFSFASEKTIVSGRVGPKTMKVVQYEIYCYSFPSSFIGIIIHFSKYIQVVVYRHILKYKLHHDIALTFSRKVNICDKELFLVPSFIIQYVPRYRKEFLAKTTKHNSQLFYNLVFDIGSTKPIILGILIRKINTVPSLLFSCNVCAHPNNAVCTTFASSEPYYMPIKQRESICNALFPAYNLGQFLSSQFFSRKSPSPLLHYYY